MMSPKRTAAVAVSGLLALSLGAAPAFAASQTQAGSGISVIEASEGCGQFTTTDHDGYTGFYMDYFGVVAEKGKTVTSECTVKLQVEGSGTLQVLGHGTYLLQPHALTTNQISIAGGVSPATKTSRYIGAADGADYRPPDKTYGNDQRVRLRGTSNEITVTMKLSIREGRELKDLPGPSAHQSESVDFKLNP